MTPEEAIRTIQAALEAGRLEVNRHLWDELRADVFVHADVQCALEGAFRATDMGFDAAENPKFEITGLAADGRVLSVVCSFKETEAVLLITAYEGIQE